MTDSEYSNPQLLDKTEAVHKRRKRYKGTHPRTYEEKYKEHNPEKYRDTIEKVISKGSTPAGMHIPIMVSEILDVLQIRPGDTGMDATLGYGGHTTRMLEQLSGRGHLFALDIDPEESAKTEARLRNQGYGPEILTVCHMNFADAKDLLSVTGPFQFILADLGVSSMQIDNPERGFSYKTDGPLDLRLNQTAGISAAERLLNVEAEELCGMLRYNADEPYAEEISAEIIRRRRKKHCPKTTRDLYEAVDQALAFLPKDEHEDAVKKSCARTFQALRIDVNQEYEVLEKFLSQLPDLLAHGGKAAILTFHSGEDRLVKQYFKAGLRDGVYSDIARDVIRPSKEECVRNSRAHSTKLRWAVRA